MAKPAAGEAQEAPLRGAVEEDLGNSERKNAGVVDPRLAARPAPLRQEIVGEHIKCDQQSVEVGRHAASLVGVALATPDFDTRPQDHASVALNSESLI